MARIYTIGEGLIDFIPEEKGVSLKEVKNFKMVVGGAPANVAAAIAKLGGKSSFICKLGKDSFGDLIVHTLNDLGVDTKYILRTHKANTALAFVSLDKNGERDFVFYRNPSADMLLNENEVEDIEFTKEDILHFCSVDLIDAPVKNAHINVIENMMNKEGIISFDPNVRLNLWYSKSKCRDTILNFIPKANILKVSSDELEFITGIKSEQEGLNSLFKGNVELIVYTKGNKGASLITKKCMVSTDGINVKVKDTTGAGDAFIGAILYSIKNKNITKEELIHLSEYDLKDMLNFANVCGALTTTKKGVIDALPFKDDVLNFLKGYSL